MAGFILNRLNVSITGLEAAQGGTYVPSWAEAFMTLMIVALAVAGFRLAVRYLPLFPDEAPVGFEPAAVPGGPGSGRNYVRNPPPRSHPSVIHSFTNDRTITPGRGGVWAREHRRPGGPLASRLPLEMERCGFESRRAAREGRV